MPETNVGEGGSGNDSAGNDWAKTLEWIEKQSQESLKARFATADLLAKEAQTTLTILLAGVGGSAAYGIKVFESTSFAPVAVASMGVCIYLVALSIILVTRCMMFQSYPALYQDPQNLMHPTFGLDAIREVELKNLGERITEAKQINDGRAKRLNQIRIAAALSPLVFAVVALISPSMQRPPVDVFVITCAPKHAASSATSAPMSFRCEVGK